MVGEASPTSVPARGWPRQADRNVSPPEHNGRRISNWGDDGGPQRRYSRGGRFLVRMFDRGSTSHDRPKQMNLAGDFGGLLAGGLARLRRRLPEATRAGRQALFRGAPVARPSKWDAAIEKLNEVLELDPELHGRLLQPGTRLQEQGRRLCRDRRPDPGHPAGPGLRGSLSPARRPVSLEGLRRQGDPRFHRGDPLAAARAGRILRPRAGLLPTATSCATPSRT